MLTNSKIRIYLVGLFITLMITLVKPLQLIYYNYQIFSFASLDFWNGINPYINWNHLSILGKHLDSFLYSPQFSILFTPFALLPDWLGLFCWNIFTYTLFFFSVFSLPAQFSFVTKKFIFFYSGLLLLQTLFGEQFNPVVAALFLFSFTLLEKDKGFWAVFLILLSGFTKVYGIFQIGMIMFYPKFWKNLFYTFVIGILLLALPLVKIPLNMLTGYYMSWIDTLIRHSQTVGYDVFYRPFYTLWNSIIPKTGIISLFLLASLYSISLFKIKLLKESIFYRIQFLGILMVWAILFSSSAEKNTYLIAVVGYTLWYLSFPTSKTDKVLLWINFVFLSILPIDILCPKYISDLLLNTLNFGIFFITVTWGFMVYKTLLSYNRIQISE